MHQPEQIESDRDCGCLTFPERPSNHKADSIAATADREAVMFCLQHGSSLEVCHTGDLGAQVSLWLPWLSWLPRHKSV